MAYSVLRSSLFPHCRLYLLSISETLITILCPTFSRLTSSPRWMKRSENSRSLKGKFVNSSFFIAIYFIRISRLTFAKFQEYFKNKPEAEIVKKEYNFVR